MVVHAASYQDEDDDDDAPTNWDLHGCAHKGLLKPLSKLLKHSKEYEIDINKVDENGQTALMLACRGGQGKAVEYLMQAGASPDIKDYEVCSGGEACKNGAQLGETHGSGPIDSDLAIDVLSDSNRLEPMVISILRSQRSTHRLFLNTCLHAGLRRRPPRRVCIRRQIYRPQSSSFRHPRAPQVPCRHGPQDCGRIHRR